jgi:hypothetical protein
MPHYHLTHAEPSLCPLPNAPFPDSICASCATLQTCKGSSVKSSSSPTNCQKLGGGRARFLVEKTTKRRETCDLLYASENNALSPLTQSFLNWFYHFYGFSYQLFLTVGALYRTVSRTYKKKYLFVFFWVLFF